MGQNCMYWTWSKHLPLICVANQSSKNSANDVVIMTCQNEKEMPERQKKLITSCEPTKSTASKLIIFARRDKTIELLIIKAHLSKRKVACVKRTSFVRGGWGLLPEYFLQCLPENQVVLPEYFPPKMVIIGGCSPRPRHPPRTPMVNDKFALSKITETPRRTRHTTRSLFRTELSIYSIADYVTFLWGLQGARDLSSFWYFWYITLCDFNAFFSFVTRETFCCFERCA